MTGKDARQKALDAAEANGTRVKPEYGSVWYDMNGPDQEHARIHVTIAIPGATAQSTGLPDSPKQGGAWIMNAGTTTAHNMTPGSQPRWRLNVFRAACSTPIVRGVTSHAYALKCYRNETNL